MRPNATFSHTSSESNKADALEQHAELAHHRLALGAAEVHGLDAVDLDRAGVGLQEAQDALHQHRLAAARAADHDEAFADPHIEIDAVEHELRPERFFQAAHGDLGHVAHG